jgi:transcriptional regulator with XRE-family HTH domain
MGKNKRGRDTFGRYVRSLRRARGLTQAEFSTLCGLSEDTIRRLEHMSFSPSLVTVSKLADGLELSLSTLFWGHDLGKRDLGRELRDLLARRSASEVELATRLLRALFAGLDAAKADGVSIWSPDARPEKPRGEP